MCSSSRDFFRIKGRGVERPEIFLLYRIVQFIHQVINYYKYYLSITVYCMGLGNVIEMDNCQKNYSRVDNLKLMI